METPNGGLNHHWSGIFPIPVTPFTDLGALDLPSLQSQVEFCLRSGASGLVYPGTVSEFPTLSDAERRSALQIIIETVGGTVPVVAGVTAPTKTIARQYSQEAVELGAVGLMVAPPPLQHFFTQSYEFQRDYFEGVADLNVPLIMQNPRVGGSVSIERLPDLVNDIPMIRYVKQESFPFTHGITLVQETIGDRIDGVFGGVGSIYLFNELDRGACGSMPSPAFVDELVTAYDSYMEGSRDRGTNRLDRLAPSFTLELLYNVAMLKWVLVERGVIASTACRVPVPVLDSIDAVQLSSELSKMGIITS